MKRIEDISDADSDQAIYKGALWTAIDELRRLDEAMKGKPASLITPAMRMRRVLLCKTVDGLRALAASLGAH